MPRVRCPHCQTRLELSSAYPGENVLCPACNKYFGLPEDAADSFADLPRRRSASGYYSSAEPWYYGFLEKIAKLVIVLTIAGLVLGSLALLIHLGKAVADARGQAELAAWTFMMVIATELGLLLAGITEIALMCLILLAVDVGRNLRRLRQNSEKG